jgi:hypothetical protein
VTGGWRKLHNEELQHLYASPNIIGVIKDDKMGRACRTNGGKEECIWDIAEKVTRKVTNRKTKTLVSRQYYNGS